MLIIPPSMPSIEVAQVQPQITKTCPLTKSIYRAISKPEFEIRFTKTKSAIASEFAALTLKHKIRGTIASFNMGGSMGYGSFYLNPIMAKPTENAKNELKPVFFDRRWQNVNGTINTSPTYLFIAGLGVEDWYSGRKGSRNQVLGDVMWQFAGCQ